MVVVHDHDGNPIERYRLVNAQPRNVASESRTADVLTEKLVITYEGLEPE